MADSYVLKQYFEQYLKAIRGLSDRSVGHYLNALTVISRVLREHGIITNEIYEILDLEALQNAKAFLKGVTDFVEQDERGHRMYTAGLNRYLEFATGADLETAAATHEVDIKILRGPQMEVVQNRFVRSSIIRNQALGFAGYHCELNSDHQTFINRYTSRPYMEGHHLIPLKLQLDFEYSLDVYANIVCLCPLCHCKLHYGLDDEREQLLGKVYDARINRLDKSGIFVYRDKFMEMAMEKY